MIFQIILTGINWKLPFRSSRYLWTNNSSNNIDSVAAVMSIKWPRYISSSNHFYTNSYGNPCGHNCTLTRYFTMRDNLLNGCWSDVDQSSSSRMYLITYLVSKSNNINWLQANRKFLEAKKHLPYVQIRQTTCKEDLSSLQKKIRKLKIQYYLL